MKPSSPAMLSVSLPVEIPSPERMEQICREEFARAAAERVKWFTVKEAAKYCGWSISTFKRKIKVRGVPPSKQDGMISYFIEDLDVMKLLELVTVGSAADNAKWPSVRRRNEILRNQPTSLHAVPAAA